MMSENKLKVGMVGGGNESFMGKIHRAAIQQSGCCELVAGAFGTTRQRSIDTGKLVGLDPKRVYGIYRDMFRREQRASADTKLDLITVIAPTNMHYPVTMAAFDAGFPVYSEKPMSSNMDEALNLKRKAIMNESIYTTGYVFPFYPVIAKIKAFIADQGVGNIRRINSQFLHGWMGVRLETAGNRSAAWRVDPRRSGAAGATVDLGGNCAFLAEYLTDLTITEVCADLHSAVAGRTIDDDASVLVHFDNGAIGCFQASQITLGEAEGVSIAIYGDKGTIHWKQATANTWTFTDTTGAITVHTIDGAVVPTAGENRFAEPYGDDAAYIEALAQSYRAFAEVIRSNRAGSPVSNETISVDRALRIAAFNDASIRNASQVADLLAEQKWTPITIPEVTLFN